MFAIDVHISDEVDLVPNDTRTGVRITPIAYHQRGVSPLVHLNLFLGSNPEQVRANGRYLIEAIERVIEMQS